MDEYILTVVADDNETSNIKSFAETIEELVDNIVCLEYVKTIISVKRIRDNKTWNTIDSESLNMLREYRSIIKNEVGLKNHLRSIEEIHENR